MCQVREISGFETLFQVSNFLLFEAHCSPYDVPNGKKNIYMTDHKLLLQHSKICLYVAMLLLTQCINLFYLVGAEDKEIIDIAIKNMFFVILR